jgi:hypothetical protein
MRLLRQALGVALEEVSDGKAFREIEHTFYARLEDLEQLKKAASMEHQEQWEVKFPKTDLNAGEGRIRIRKTVVDGKDPEYVLTCKTSIAKSNDKIEVPIPTTEPMFQQFRMMSEKGMIKDRYHFPVSGTDLVWEVDMFYLPGAEVGSGQYCEWCKIDLEVKDRDAALPPFPIEFAEMILGQYGERSEAEEAKVRALYDTEFVAANPYLNK